MPGATDHNYCSSDIDSNGGPNDGHSASEVCEECGECTKVITEPEPESKPE